MREYFNLREITLVDFCIKFISGGVVRCSKHEFQTVIKFSLLFLSYFFSQWSIENENTFSPSMKYGRATVSTKNNTVLKSLVMLMKERLCKILLSTQS